MSRWWNQNGGSSGEEERIRKEIQGEIANVKGHFQNSMEA